MHASNLFKIHTYAEAARHASIAAIVAVALSLLSYSLAMPLWGIAFGLFAVRIAVVTMGHALFDTQLRVNAWARGMHDPLTKASLWLAGAMVTSFRWPLVGFGMGAALGATRGMVVA